MSKLHWSRFSSNLSPEDILKLYPIVKDILKLVKKLYDRAKPETRLNVRIGLVGSIALLPTVSVGTVLSLLGILNFSKAPTLVGMIPCAFTFIATFPLLCRWLGRYIDLKPPRET